MTRLVEVQGQTPVPGNATYLSVFFFVRLSISLYVVFTWRTLFFL